MPVYKDTKAKSGSYYFVVSYTDNHGAYKQYKSKRFRTQKECKEAEAKFLLSNHKPTALNLTFSRLIGIYLDEYKSLVKPQTFPHTVDVCNHILESLGNVDVADMSRNQYEEFRNRLSEKELSANYKNKIVRQLKALLKYAYDRFDVWNDVPSKYPSFKDTQDVKEIDFYTLDEFNKFISVVDDPRYVGLFTTLFFCGLRLGEANGLQFKDIYDNRIHINKTVSTKMKGDGARYLSTAPKTPSSIRNIPMPKRVAESIKTLREMWQQEKDFSEDYYVFGGFFPLPETSIQVMKNKYCDLADLRRIRIHDFRHSCASLLINNGANVTLVAKYLGHSDIKMTLNTYSHLWEDKLEEITDAIDRF